MTKYYIFKKKKGNERIHATESRGMMMMRGIIHIYTHIHTYENGIYNHPDYFV